jgi:small subunit ribosomal protein S20
MPLLKHAIKKMRQDAKRTARRRQQESHMKTLVKKVVELSQRGGREEAGRLLPIAFKAVDIAAKKHIIHSRTAARRKARMSRLVSGKL